MCSDWRKIEAELIHIFSCSVDVANASGVHYLGVAATEYTWDADGPRPIEVDGRNKVAILANANHDIIDLQSLAQRLARL